MLKKYPISAFLISALVLAGCAQTVEAPPVDTTDTTETSGTQLPDVIKIGYIGPLTGNAAGYGQDVKNGIALYFSENPTISGKPVEIIYEDGKCNGQDAANAAQKLITVDKVQVILGGQCSGETLAAAPIAEQNKVLLFSELSSSPEITTAGDYVFRNYPSDLQVAKTLVDDVLKNHEKVALLTEQTDYAQGYRGAVNQHMQTAGQTLVLDEVFPVDNSDFRTLLTKVKESGADVLILAPQSPVVAGFAVKQAKELGLDIQIYGTDTFPGPDFFNTALDAAQGVKAVYVTEDSNRTGYNEVKTKLGEPQSADIFRLFGYDASAIISTAITQVGYDATKIKDYLYAMPVYKGVASDIKFDENGDNQAPAAVKIAKDGKFVPITE